MSRIDSRLNMVEQAIKKSHPSEEDELMFFVRPDPWHPEIPTKEEIKWRGEHPDFRGKIYIYTIGSKNLGPRPDGV